MDCVDPLDLRIGDKIVFTGENGYEHHKQYAELRGLVVGQEYTVCGVEVNDWDSYVYLDGIKTATGNIASFNPLMFVKA
jgi:hypothetical protein